MYNTYESIINCIREVTINMQIDINPNSDLIRVIPPSSLIKIPKGMPQKGSRFQETMLMYSSAIKTVRTKIEVLNDELSIRNCRNPIEMIKSRVKKAESIVEKLNRRGLNVTIDSMIENVYDIAGIRVICSFVDDIYDVANMLRSQDDIRVINTKDYIRNPKDNGYRSYHMIIETPVFFSDKKINVKVEIQIRTIAMDFWASLDHQLKYKKNIENADVIVAELKDCADVIAAKDDRMRNIRRILEKKI